MVRWVVIFKDAPEMLNIRARKDLRDAHVAYAKDHPELLIGGGLKPETDKPFCGALWIVEVATKEQVIELVKNDLFIQKDSDICANPNLFDPESFRYFITAFFESFPEYLLK